MSSYLTLLSVHDSAYQHMKYLLSFPPPSHPLSSLSSSPPSLPNQASSTVSICCCQIFRVETGTTKVFKPILKMIPYRDSKSSVSLSYARPLRVFYVVSVFKGDACMHVSSWSLIALLVEHTKLTPFIRLVCPSPSPSMV